MRKLLRADFMRLWKDQVFRLFLVLFCVGGAFLPILHTIQNKNGTENWTMDDGFFVFVTVVSVALSVFAALFVGSAYSDGTMRNKVVVGHSRCAIYLSHLLVTMTAGLLFALAYVALDGASALVADEDRGAVGLERSGAPGIARHFLRKVVDDRLDMLAGA